MTKVKQITEFDILELYADEMERQGAGRQQVRLSVDDSMLSALCEKLNIRATLEELQMSADKCFANEWLEHTILGGGKYGYLSLTAMGLEVVRSVQYQKETLEKRSLLKRFSDYIEDHKGLFVVLSAVIALIGLVLTM